VVAATTWLAWPSARVGSTTIALKPPPKPSGPDLGVVEMNHAVVEDAENELDGADCAMRCLFDGERVMSDIPLPSAA
jgi:hypothetical protein